MKPSFRMNFLLCGLVVLAVLACISPVFAQQTLGSINGTVTDPSGAAVVGAKVTVSASAIGVTRSTITQSTGFYQVFNLPVGTYSVKVAHEGFDTTDVAGIQVQEAQARTVNATLKVGRASESV